jgi:hypothetical protein
MFAGAFTLPGRGLRREFLRELDEVVLPRGFVRRELAGAVHEDGGFHRLGDEFSFPFLELVAHRFAFGDELRGDAVAFGGHVAVEAGLLVFEGGL